MLSRFHLIPERHGQTDGQTDRQTGRQTDRFAISISRVSMLTRDKNDSKTENVTLIQSCCTSSITFLYFLPLMNILLNEC